MNDSVRRQYNQIQELLKSKKPLDSSTYHPLMVELCKIENKVEVIEREASMLLQSRSFENEKDTDELLTATIKSISQHPENQSTFAYQVKTPLQLEETVDVEKEISALRESVHSLQAMITRLEEQGEGSSLSSLLSHMEHIVTILNPGFLRRMEIDYAVRK